MYSWVLNGLRQHILVLVCKHSKHIKKENWHNNTHLLILKVGKKQDLHSGYYNPRTHHTPLKIMISSKQLGVNMFVGWSPTRRENKRALSDEKRPTNGTPPLSSPAVADEPMAKEDWNLQREVTACAKSRCCSIETSKMCWSSKLPLKKVKILVGVWQTLADSPSITGVDCTVSCSTFLS